MSNSIYRINKGINASIEFKGLKAQYIWWLGGGLVCLLIFFAVMYFIGINTFVCLGIILIAGTGLFMWVFNLSKTHGEHGLMKKMAKRKVPRAIKCYSRKLFY